VRYILTPFQNAAHQIRYEIFDSFVLCVQGIKMDPLLSMALLACFGSAMAEKCDANEEKEIVTGQIYSDPIDYIFLIMWVIGPPMALAASFYMLIVHIPRCIKASQTVRNIPVTDNATQATVYILQCIPVFGISASIAMFWPEMTDVMQFIQSVSIAVGFIHYCQLLIWLLGGAENALEKWANVLPTKIWATVPLCFLAPFHRKQCLGVKALQQIRFWSYQYVIVGPFVAFLDVAITDRIRDDYVDEAENVLLVVQIISNLRPHEKTANKFRVFLCLP
jgi:hypothetical protein